MSDQSIERLGDSLRDASILADGEAVEAYCMLSEALCDYLPASVLARVMRQVAEAGVEERTRVQHVLDRRVAVAREEAHALAESYRQQVAVHGVDRPVEACAMTDAQATAIAAQVLIYGHDSTPCAGLHAYSVQSYAEWLAEYDPEASVPAEYDGAVIGRFTYVREGEEVDTFTGVGLGVEETVYAHDGRVLTSQDLG